jgi:hypothetical protein
VLREVFAAPNVLHLFCHDEPESAGIPAGAAALEIFFSAKPDEPIDIVY